MVKKIPDKLFLCMMKTKYAEKGGKELAESVYDEHTRYMSDLWEKGIFWAGGPTVDGDPAIEIYSVDSVEEAMKAQRNAPIYLNGYVYDDKYWEWHPMHWPPPTPNIDPSTGKKTDT